MSVLIKAMLKQTTKYSTPRVQNTNRIERRCYVYSNEEERKLGVQEKNRRYYAKYKVIAQRKQRMRYAKKKLEETVHKLGIAPLGR